MPHASYPDVAVNDSEVSCTKDTGWLLIKRHSSPSLSSGLRIPEFSKDLVMGTGGIPLLDSCVWELVGGNIRFNDWVIMAIRQRSYKDEPVSLSTAALVHWFIVRESFTEIISCRGS
jgi:hypothetical protein